MDSPCQSHLGFVTWRASADAPSQVERRRDTHMASSETALFDAVPFAKGLTLRNRVVMAPMTTWSGNEDGTVSAEEEVYYRRRVNGAGLVITGCTHVTPDGIGFTGEFAAYDDRFLPSLKRLAAAANSGG